MAFFVQNYYVRTHTHKNSLHADSFKNRYFRLAPLLSYANVFALNHLVHRCARVAELADALDSGSSE